MASVPKTAEKKAKLSDANAARTATGADFDALMVLSLVGKIYKPVKELWSVSKALDPDVPRAVHLSVEVPADVRTTLLRQQERKANGQHYCCVVGVLLGGPRAWEMKDKLDPDVNVKKDDVDETITRDPSVAIALTMLPPSLKYLRFASHYNLPIALTLGNAIEEIKFGDEFDHEVDLRHITGLETVVFGKLFNHQVHLSAGVKRLVFSRRFNQKVDLPRGLVQLKLLSLDFDHNLELPSSLKLLWIFSMDFNRVLSLPDGLEDLMLGRSFNRPLTLPPSLRVLWFLPLSQFNQPLVGLPAGLKQLLLGRMFNHPLQDLPAGLEKLEFADWADDFNDETPCQYNSPITLPPALREATFGYSFNQPIELNDALERVEFGHSFDQELTIPTGLKKLTVPRHYPHDKLIMLPEGGPRTWERECSDEKAVYYFCCCGECDHK